MWKLSSNVNEDIPFNEEESKDLLEELTVALGKTDIPDTLFFCPDIGDPRLPEKFLNVMFLDGTFLASPHFKTCLTLAAITTDHRTVPLAHMFHTGGENVAHATAFLALTKIHLKHVNWESTSIMADQSRALETAIKCIFKTQSLTCGLHLFKNVVKHTEGKPYSHFNTLCQTLDKQKQEDAQKALLDMFYPKSKNGRTPTYKKIESELARFTRLNKPCGFEAQTTNGVEQLHSSMRYMKQGNVVNFVTHLSVLQLHALNKLQTENCRDHPKFTFYAETILSLQLALATAFKVELKSPGVYNVSYDKDRNYPIVKVYAQYMKKLGRRKSLWRYRREYLDSLITCTAVEVTEVSCSLCPAAVDYMRCPHVVAVRGLLSFPVERQEMADADVTILWSHVSRLLERHTFFSVVNLSGAHPALYHGYLPTPGSGTSSKLLRLSMMPYLFLLK